MEDDETPIGKHYPSRPGTPANRVGGIGVGVFAVGVLALFFNTWLALGLFATAGILYGVFYVIQP